MVDPSVEADVRAVRQLLGLDPAGREFQVVYGSVAANLTQLAILSRSILEILVDLVPHRHWFWIDDGGHAIEAALVETGGKDGAPVLTIPTQ